ncbi:AAA family ATPase [Halobacteriaceae archaeon SHR40]|uniref:Cdc6/Cdc18 family protein n=1 Tax=Halovenus amylolytica TaxID=2500550 RepID=UPI000FE2FFAB
MTFTRTENSPFENSQVLAEDFIPEEVLGRDEELEQISEVLQQIVDNEQPVNAFIYGISGTGKTVSIKYKQRELEQALERYDDVHATFVYQNCESLSSSYQAAIAIANSYLENPEYDYLHEEINLARNQIPSSGLPKERVYDILFDIFDLLTYRHTEYRSQIETALQETTLDVTVSASELVSPGDDPSVSSDKRTEILEKLHSEFDIRPPEEVTDYVTVILDEVDRIGTRDELLYEIPRSRTNSRVDDILPSVIGISNDVGYKESIQSKTDSSLRLKEITFKKYDIDQLQEILSQRAEKAFKSEAYDGDIIPLASAFGRKQGGDARYAIDLLHKSGMKTKKDESTRVTEEHVRQAHEEKERDRVYEVTNDLSQQEKIVLAAIMYHDLREETPIARGEMYPTYKKYSQSTLDNSNVPRRVADYLKKMSQLGLLDRRDAYQGPGESGFEYSLDKVDYNMIFQILGDEEPTGEGGSLLPDELITEFKQQSSSGDTNTQTDFDSFD